MTPNDVKVGTHALRSFMDATGYGDYVSDTDLAQAASAVITAVDKARDAASSPAPAALPIPVRMVGD